MLKRMYHWMGNRVYSEYADITLATLFYIEAIFFLPTDPMLIFYCIERRHHGIRYATIAMISSVFGGITAYFIGYYFWCFSGKHIIQSRIVTTIMTPQTFHYLCNRYQEHQYVAILLAAFTPIPYKAATLTAGFCRLPFIPFVLCSLIARGARFYLFALIIKRWGDTMKKNIEYWISLVIILMTMVIFLTMWWLHY